MYFLGPVPELIIYLVSIFLAYMDLRSANVSAIIGPYAQPIVTSSERFAIPYFLSNNDTPKFYTPVNLITVFPSMTEINRICFHVIQKYYWQDVLVFYDSQDGKFSMHCPSLLSKINLKLILAKNLKLF